MKKTDLIFSNSEMQDTFLKDCLFNNVDFQADGVDCTREEYYNFIDSIIELSKDTNDFVHNFLAHSEFKRLRCYQQLLKSMCPNDIWCFVRENFGEKCFKTISDVGGVKVGTNEFSVVLTNGYGDGDTRVAIFDNEDDFYSSDLMFFNTVIDGHFFIYDYDCGENVAKEISGRFAVYYYEGLVAFVNCTQKEK